MHWSYQYVLFTRIFLVSIHFWVLLSHPDSLDEISTTSVIVLYWKKILERQIDILIWIRSIRESNFQQHILVLHTLMKWYFALPYYYSWWLTVHLLDLVTLEQQQPVVYKMFNKWYFSYNKSYFQSSTMALDQLHEQSNDEIIKIVGGVTRLLNRGEVSFASLELLWKWNRRYD